MAEGHIGKILGGRYRVDSLIESNGLAELYRGKNTAVDREVTIKVVDPQFAVLRDDIFEEARKVSRISHPNILSVTDLGEDDGTLYVVYEAFDGESLKAAMASGQFPVDRAIRITRETAEALGTVHPTRNAHSRLTAENILLAESGDNETETVKVLNFFATDGSDGVLDSGIEELNYTAPELIGGKPVDERSDVYTLGSLLFRLLTGEIPFPATSLPDAVSKIENDPPPPMSSFRTDLPAGLERVILTAMAKNPEMRYQTVAELSGELAKFSTEAGVTTAAAPGASAHDIWKTAFAVLAAVSLLTVALIYATSVKSTDPTTQLQPDANGQPVQPIGPATGVAEQNLASMQDPSADSMSNSNTALPPGTLPGGDGYDPWKNGGKPPPGAPVNPGGQVVTIDPNNPSPFMTNDGPCIPQPSGIVLCPAPVNRAVKPTPTPKPSAANANVAPKTTPTPEVKPSPAVTKPPAKPAPTPKPGQSGKPRNGDDL